MYNVGGRVREGKPPKLWSSFGDGFKTPATGAVDDGKRASSAIEVESQASATQGGVWGGIAAGRLGGVMRS